MELRDKVTVGLQAIVDKARDVDGLVSGIVGASQQQRQGIFSPAAVELMVATARLLPIRLYADSDLHRDAHRFATELNLPATYDAHYLATAALNDATFWTSDKRLVSLVRGKLDWVRYVLRKDEAIDLL